MEAFELLSVQSLTHFLLICFFCLFLLAVYAGRFEVVEPFVLSAHDRTHKWSVELAVLNLQAQVLLFFDLPFASVIFVDSLFDAALLI